MAYNHRQQQWVSLKILTADATPRSTEAQTLRTLQQHQTIHHAVRLLDSFVHAGPNGRHQCLVLELLGPSVERFVKDNKDSGEQTDPNVILKITKQLLEGLASLHEAGYAHGSRHSTQALKFEVGFN